MIQTDLFLKHCINKFHFKFYIHYIVTSLIIKFFSIFDEFKYFGFQSANSPDAVTMTKTLSHIPHRLH